VTLAAQELLARLVHISTDYVFGDEAESHTIPYTKFDKPVPLNIYGKSWTAGEKFVQHICSRHFIFRTTGFLELLI